MGIRVHLKPFASTVLPALRRLTVRSVAARPGRRGGILCGLLMVTLLLGVSPVQAQVDPYRLYLAQRGDIPWESLSPEEQQALKRYRGDWDDYSGDRQQRLRQGAQRYMDLPPDKRRQVEQQRREYEQLSPQERERLRKEYQRRNRQ